MKEDYALIEVKHLTKRYGANTVVNDLTFKIESGKIYGFLGPNGAGKSTTMNMITGCLAMTDGTVTIDGHDIIADAEAAKRCVGYLPENPPLYGDMTPREYLTFVARAKGVEKAHVNDQVESVMEETHITAMQNRLIRNLSKGFKQRVGIAQAMLGDPKLIILDEPTVGLDPQQILQIRDLILTLGKTRTVLLSSHILAEISAVCDHVMILSHGKMVANGTLDSIRRAYAGDNLITLEVKGTEKSIQGVLSSLRNAKESEMVEIEKNVYRVKITVRESYDMREEVFNAFAAAKCPILSMASSALTLEDVFLRLTTDSIEDEEEETDAVTANASDLLEQTDEEKDEEEYDDDDAQDDYKPLFGGKKKDEEDDD